MDRSTCSSLVILVAMVSQTGIGQSIAADAPTIKTFDSNGTKISYSVQGKGKPVVLIHGWLSSSQINWAFPGTSALLARDYQVIALDVRGHGQSDKPTTEEAYGLELIADVLRLLDHLKIDKAHIVGYSMGGLIAAKFIAKHPDRVLTGTLGGMGWSQDGGAAQWAFGRIGKNESNANALTLCGRSLSKLSLTESELKSIKAPMTVLVGENDRLIHRLYIEPLKQARPDWPIIEIKDGNHLNCIMKPQFQEELAGSLKK